jgi:hypothetical protein
MFWVLKGCIQRTGSRVKHEKTKIDHSTPKSLVAKATQSTYGVTRQLTVTRHVEHTVSVTVLILGLCEVLELT